MTWLLLLATLAAVVLIGAVLLARDDTRYDRVARAAIARIGQPAPRFRSRW